MSSYYVEWFKKYYDEHLVSWIFFFFSETFGTCIFVPILYLFNFLDKTELITVPTE